MPSSAPDLKKLGQPVRRSPGSLSSGRNFHAHQIRTLLSMFCILLLVGCATPTPLPPAAIITEVPRPDPTQTINPQPTATSTPQPTHTPTLVPTLNYPDAVVDGQTVTKYFNVEQAIRVPVTVKEGETEVSSTFTFGLTKEFLKFTYAYGKKIASIRFSDKDLPQRMYKRFLMACWQRYNWQHPENAQSTLEDYMKLLQNNQGMIVIPGVEEENNETDLTNRVELQVNPLDGFAYVLHTGTLPQVIRYPEEEVYFGQNQNHELVSIDSYNISYTFNNTRSYSGKTAVNTAAGIIMGYPSNLRIIAFAPNDGLMAGSFRDFQVIYEQEEEQLALFKGLNFLNSVDPAQLVIKFVDKK